LVGDDDPSDRQQARSTSGSTKASDPFDPTSETPRLDPTSAEHWSADFVQSFMDMTPRFVEQDVEEVNVGVDCLRCLWYRGIVDGIERHYHNSNLGVHFFDLVHNKLDLDLATTHKDYAAWIRGRWGERCLCSDIVWTRTCDEN
jgi:hypothetical protein